jgi:hypothetical protein
VWSQCWLDVLFLHWRVPVSSLQPHLPPGVEVEAYRESAWLSLVLFRLKVRPRWLPFVPGISSFTEVNLRTYVRARERSGIYFLSISADNKWSVRLARLCTPLPYQAVPMSYRQMGSDFCFVRRPRGSGGALTLVFRPRPGCRTPADGSLDTWLLERYRAFAWSRRRRLVAADVAHARWSVQDVEWLRVSSERSSWWDGVPPRAPDLSHYSEGVQAQFGAFRTAQTGQPLQERLPRETLASAPHPPRLLGAPVAEVRPQPHSIGIVWRRDQTAPRPP